MLPGNIYQILPILPSTTRFCIQGEVKGSDVGKSGSKAFESRAIGNMPF